MHTYNACWAHARLSTVGVHASSHCEDLVAIGCDEDCVLTLRCQATIYCCGCPVILPHLDLVAAFYKDGLYGERLVYLQCSTPKSVFYPNECAGGLLLCWDCACQHLHAAWLHVCPYNTLGCRPSCLRAVAEAYVAQQVCQVIAAALEQQLQVARHPTCCCDSVTDSCHNNHPAVAHLHLIWLRVPVVKHLRRCMEDCAHAMPYEVPYHRQLVLRRHISARCANGTDGHTRPTQLQHKRDRQRQLARTHKHFALTTKQTRGAMVLL